MLFLCENPRYIERAFIMISVDDLADKNAAFIYRRLVLLAHEKEVTFTRIIEQFADNSKAQDFITRSLMTGNRFKNNAEAQADEFIYKIRKAVLDERSGRIKVKLKEAELGTDQTIITRLLEDKMHIDEEREKLKGFIH